MLKKLIAVAALATCALAHAEVKQLQVVYKGFIEYRTGAFNPNARLEAYFDVDDLNHDGTYTMDELVSFRAGSVTSTGGCGDHPVVENCLDSFSYTPGGTVSFSGFYAVHDEMFYISQTWRTGAYFEDSYSTMWGGGYYRRYTWTDETQTFVLSATPAVPEPEQFAMLGVGLIGLLAAARRRR